jgi:hypothetical protein
MNVLNIDCTTLDVAELRGVDAIICDPPYSRHVHENAMSCSATNGKSLGVKERDLGFGHLTPGLRRWLARASAEVRTWSLFYSDVESQWLWRTACTAAGAEYVRTLPWVRWSQPQLSGDRPSTGCELVTIVHSQDVGKRGALKPRRKAWNGSGNLLALYHEDVALNDLAHKCLRGEDKYKAEKPLDQLLALVSAFTRPGDVVADFCAGVGTTGAACALLGRQFIGSEILPEVCERANERIVRALDRQLSERDAERLERWIKDTDAEVQRTLAEKSTTEKAAERALRRGADVDYARKPVRVAA